MGFDNLAYKKFLYTVFYRKKSTFSRKNFFYHEKLFGFFVSAKVPSVEVD